MFRLRKPHLVVLLASVSFGALAAHAPAMTIDVGTPDVQGRVLVTVPVTVTCEPFEATRTHFASYVFVSIRQASGPAVASGSGTVYGSLPSAPLAFVCDGTPQLVQVPVLASSDSRPFHGGQAVLTAGAAADAGDPCFPGTTSCFMNTVSQRQSFGPALVRLR